MWSKSNGSETEYTYDAAGRLLLTNTDNEYYQRTVYDNNGRIVQELDNDKYNPALDNLPNAYSDTSAGKTYVYNENGDLISEKNKYGITTEYAYSEKGNVCRKSFDIYDYYYTDGGKCSSVAVGGDTIVNYSYNVDDFEKELKEGQKADRITYADGYIEEHITDKYGISYYKYANGKQFYGVYKDINSKRLSYYEGELRRTNTLYVENENRYSFTQREDFSNETFTYNVVKEDNQQTVTEMHNKKTYQTVAEENKITYISENATAVYTVDGNENEAVCKISIDDAEVLVSNVSYDEESNTLAKSYGEELDYYSVYDNDGNIIGDEINSYTYNELGELISTSGLVNASYQYDSRGNMLSKTVGDNTTSYSYDNAEWKDQLTSVNGIPLTYDANGNLASYGDTTYTWSHGKQLESVTDDENLYSYKYNSLGYRVSKTVNGYTTNYDTLSGLVLAQSGREGTIYFQYNGNSPVGFILNDVQYFYITNNCGDIVGITDNAGNIIATYTYDEWGKLLSIETAEENNAEQLKIAKTNPLRYRGYYYDNETGYYYLQSRYYDPDLGRFISADDFSYINPDAPLNINAYSYCWNNPVAFEDAEGTTPQISIDLTALQPLVDGASAVIKAGLNKFAENIKKLISKYNEFIDKLEFNINHPDVVINNGLSKLLGREVSLKFPLINAIRTYFGTFDIRKGELVGGLGDGYRINDSDNEESGIVVYSSGSTSSESNNAVMAIFQGIVAAIEFDWLNKLLEFFGSGLEELSKEASIILVTTFNTIIDYFKNSLVLDFGISGEGEFLNKAEKATNGGGDLVDGKGIGRGFGGFAAALKFLIDIDSAGEGIYTKTEDIILATISLAASILLICVPQISFVWGLIITASSDIIPDIILLLKYGYIAPVRINKDE